MKVNKKRIKMGVMLGCSAAILMGFSSSVLAKKHHHHHHHSSIGKSISHTADKTGKGAESTADKAGNAITAKIPNKEYHCDNGLICCDPSAEKSCNNDAHFGSNSDLGKHKVDGNASIDLQLHCDGGYVISNYGTKSEGGSIKCDALGGGTHWTSHMQIQCHNSSSQAGHAWPTYLDCSDD